MFRRRRAKLYFLKLRALLMFSLLVRFFVGLVEIFSVVGDLANRRVGGRRNFHQIQALLPGKLNRLERRHHTQLPAILIHHANFTRPDSVVHPYPVCLPKTPFRDKPTSENRAKPTPKSQASRRLLPSHPFPQRHNASGRDGSQSIARRQAGAIPGDT